MNLDQLSPWQIPDFAGYSILIAMGIFLCVQNKQVYSL